MNILQKLLDACETDEQQDEVREAAIRAKLLWRCDAQDGDCGWVNEVEHETCQAGLGCPGKRPFPRSEKIAEVLCDSSSEFDLEAGKLATLEDVVAVYGLDGACLTNVVVLRTEDGRFHVGEFLFEIREVSEEEARQVAADYGDEEDDEEPEMCERCGSIDDMNYVAADRAFYCSDCGHAHVIEAQCDVIEDVSDLDAEHDAIDRSEGKD